MITVSVPGKVHLMGEHAVVYGKPAFLAAVNLRMRVTVVEGTGKIISSEPIDHARYAVTFLLNQLKIAKPKKTNVTIDSDIPAGFHLGSSAAVAVGITGAMMYFHKKIWNPIRINELAYEIEKKQHGAPSGGDNTIVTMGGFIWYRKELEFLKSIWQLPFKTKLHHFFLIDTGKPRETTGEMVAFVAKQPNVQKFCVENEIQTKRIAVALKENDEQVFIDAMRKGERSLEEIGVVSKKAIEQIRSIEKSGGAAKILGGGGKKDGVGYLLCYAHNLPAAGIPITLGEEGIRLEKKS